MYADLEDPNFGSPFENRPPKKASAPVKKITNNNNKKPNIKNNNNFKNINNNKNINYNKNINNNFKKVNNNKNINNNINNFYNNFGDDDYDDDYNYKKKLNDDYDDEDYNDKDNDDEDFNYDKNIIEDPLSMFSSPKYTYEDNDDQNIIVGTEDIKSKIDIPKIESIVKSLKDETHRYRSIEEFQQVLKNIAIKNNLNSQESQAFLIYCWLAKNLSYYTGSTPDNTPLGALQKRITQCSGYSRLYKELLKIFKIKSVLVHGIGRTYNLDPRPKTENHEWNAIKLNGEYYLCEVTWGAGKVENNKFVRNYSTFYFCCPPEIFIMTHYPSKDLSKWMLLDKKISQDQFENILYKDKYFYHYGFSDIQPSQGIIKLTNQNSIEIKFENYSQIKKLRLSCKVFVENRILENVSYIEKFEDYFLVNLLLNKRGHYNVIYFATDKSGTVHSELIARQQIYVMNDSKQIKVFPTIFNFPDELYIREPKYNYLPRNKEILFRFSSNEIDDMGIVINQKCMHLQKVDDTFIGKFIISGDEILVGKFELDNPKNMKVMIKYKVRK